jgi:membrane protein implicated in regulation of membrane protease activity
VIAKVLFLVIFVAGLGLAVYSMLHGVERSKASARQRPSSVLNTPTASAFGVVLGATGYLLVTRTTLGITAIFIIAAIFAFAAMAAMIALMSRWALPYSGIATGDEALQGQLARVTSPISASSKGEIAFHAGGVRRTLPAQSLQKSEIPYDTEVVIDTIQDGVAQVELWSTVEQRL